MMKKILTALIALSMLLCAAASAETLQPEEFKLSGLITSIEEDGSLLLQTGTNGDVLVRIAEDAVLTGVTEYKPGQYVYVTYGGIMTMSLPAQITAQEIRSFYLTGEVAAVAGHNVALKTADGDVCVVLADDIDVIFGIGESIELWGEETEQTFAGLPVVNASFVGTVAPDKARD